ncbi:hypothetical protein [Pyxidicoccus xibeiensis]|uniref:hypothetical protein n=1 Tax=Pyxidicoccus xibeiensis TaxID=2906759 RepID=UPI0020A7C10D|nr:hypothetical protein [Pyxidicoccus xibeiensis]MCP3137650.1 hypothetical protein [Pyxidicoccus xibeiensis]
MSIRHLPWGKSLLVSLLLGGTASAQVPNEGRCAADPLFNNAQSNERIEWALRCGYITPQMAWGYRYYFDVSTSTVRPKAVYTYPLFGWLTDLYTSLVWVAPINRSASCQVPYSAAHGAYAHVITECIMG